MWRGWVSVKPYTNGPQLSLLYVKTFYFVRWRKNGYLEDQRLNVTSTSHHKHMSIAQPYSLAFFLCYVCVCGESSSVIWPNPLKSSIWPTDEEASIGTWRWRLCCTSAMSPWSILQFPRLPENLADLMLWLSGMSPGWVILALMQLVTAPLHPLLPLAKIKCSESTIDPVNVADVHQESLHVMCESMQVLMFLATHFLIIAFAFSLIALEPHLIMSTTANSFFPQYCGGSWRKSIFLALLPTFFLTGVVFVVRVEQSINHKF